MHTMRLLTPACTISVERVMCEFAKITMRLEGSSVAYSMVREWTISNTTLEQVFPTSVYRIIA